MSNTNKQTTFILLAALLFLTVPVFAHADFIAATMYQIVQKFFGLFFVLAGYLLDFAVQGFIIDFGKDFNNTGVGVAVNTIWVNIRDIFNLTFIFGLVYLGFKMILGSDDSQSRRWLAHLILAALFVNFSLYISKFIVDFTNLLATHIVMGAFENAGTSGTGAINISKTFMNSMGITSLVGEGSGIPPGAGDAPWGYIFGSVIILLTGTFVFAAGAFLLIIRYASLLLYMIFSPLMFIGWVFPQLQSMTDKYWKDFLGKAFFAPVYVLMLYISSSIIFAFYGGKNADFGQLTNPTSAIDVNNVFQQTLPPFIVSSILLVASIVVASKLGADGAGAALKVGKKFRRKVQRGVGSVTAGAAAGLARNTAGRYANHLAKSEKWRARGAKSFRGKLALQAARGVAGSSFDARQVGGLGKELGVGSGRTGGYKKSEDDKIKADQQFSDSLGKIETRGEDGKLKVDYEEIITERAHGSDSAKKARGEVKAVEDNNERLKSELHDKTKGGSVDKQKAEAQKKIDDIKARVVVGGEADIKNAEDLKDAENEFANIETDLSSQIDSLKADIKKGEDSLKQAEATVSNVVKAAEATEEAKIVYGNQIDYANQVNAVPEFMKKVQKSRVGEAFGGRVGEAIGGVSEASMGAVSHANLIKKQGVDGEKLMASDKEMKAARVRAKADKEVADAAGTINEPKSDDSKDDV